MWISVRAGSEFHSPRIVFDRVEADRHQHIGVADHDVAGLVAEQSDAPDELIFQFARHHAGRLKRLDNRQIGDREQLAQRRTWLRLAGANADEQNRALCGPNQVDGLCNSDQPVRDPTPAPAIGSTIAAEVAAANTSAGSTTAAAPRGG